MIRKPVHIFAFLLCGIILFASQAFPCSTFMLSRDDCLVIGHNLDQSFYTPGMIHVNRRSEIKRSVSCFDLGLTDIETPILEWTSKYGSITFSHLGRNLPDGGMNEAGLTVSEMGLGESIFSLNDSLPAMLIHLWIQYQLDSYAMVEEVLEHLGDINVEPSSTFTPPASANYHLFVTDIRGNVAIIEFLYGGPQVYKNESVPIPALCNLKYRQELEGFKRCRGIGGWIKRHLDPQKDTRFIRCAEALEEFKTSTDIEPVEYGFELLKQLQFESTKQWSVVYDARNGHVYFRTAGGPNIRHFDFDSLDFSAEADPVIYEDIDIDAKGDVSDRFVAFTPEADRLVIDRFLRSLVRFVAKTDEQEKMDRHMLENYGMDMNSYITRAYKVTELIRGKKD